MTKLMALEKSVTASTGLLEMEEPSVKVGKTVLYCALQLSLNIECKCIFFKVTMHQIIV